jgi:hypothetical protein
MTGQSWRIGLEKPFPMQRISLPEYEALFDKVFEEFTENVKGRSLHNAESRDSVEESGLDGARDAA